MIFKDNYNKRPRGQIGMIMHDGGEYDIKSNSIKGGIVIAERAVPNLIVDKASELMAIRMSPPYEDIGPVITGIDYGLQYLAVGVGELQHPGQPYDKFTNPTLWDLQDPPLETTDQKTLYGELIRKPFTSWCFVNTANENVTTPTNVLKLITTFYEGEAVGPLVEMGIFGGNATDVRDSGYLFNYKTFSVWNKSSASRLTCTWRLTF